MTVLIGSYNNAQTLARAIQSILAQTVEELELIVVDDGSTDDTAAVVAATGDPRVTRLPLSHMGIARSLNAGVAAARAPFVAVLDADDTAHPERLERQLAVLDTRPEVAVVGCRMREIDEYGHELRPRTGRATGDVRRALMRFNPIPNSSATFRRGVVLAAGGYDARYSYAAEYDLWLRLAERHVVWNLSEELATRVLGGGNVAARHDRAQVAETIVLRVRALGRRRTVAGATGLLRPCAVYVTPLAIRRWTRRLRGQGP